MNIFESLIDYFLKNEPISVADIGAAQFSSTEDRYKKLLKYRNTTIIGFEPNPDEYNSLIEKNNQNEQLCYLPHVIADGKPHTLNICKLSGCSSILEPNLELSCNYPSFGEHMEVIETIKLESKKLDDIIGMEKNDFLKIDTQGSELIILQNATKTLDHTLIIECEVEFIQQYLEQPLFSEIELFLRKRGFIFYQFLGYGSRMIKPYPADENPLQPGGQWLWSDAIFIKNPMHWDSLSTAALVKISIIFYELYQANDFTYKALSIVDLRNGSNFADIFLNQITNNQG